MTKSPIIIVVTAVVMTMISSSIISMTHAQQSKISGSKFGTIASLQYGRVSYKYPQLKVPWILSVHGNLRILIPVLEYCRRSYTSTAVIVVHFGDKIK